MKKYMLFNIILFVFMLACDKSEDDIINENSDLETEEDTILDNTTNKEPEPFNLLEVLDNAVDVDVLPILKWEVSKDDDDVTYEVFVDTKNPPVNLLAKDLSINQYKLEKKIFTSQKYFWKVVAKDSKGASTESSIFSFTTKKIEPTINLIKEKGSFGERYNHKVVVLNNKLFLLSGITIGAGKRTDIWSSDDGSSFNQVNSFKSSYFEGSFDAVEFKDKIWITNSENGVFSTTDGMTLNVVNDQIKFGGRYASNRSVVFNDKIWVISNDRYTNHISFSNDGKNWANAKKPPFSGRKGYSLVAFNNKLWVIGGQSIDETLNSVYNNDVWYTEDGENWNRAIEEAPFSKRHKHSSVVYDGKIWVIGGSDGTGADNGNLYENGLNDIWYSADGENWTMMVEKAPFSVRYNCSSTIFDDKIFIIGGISRSTGIVGDIWTIE